MSIIQKRPIVATFSVSMARQTWPTCLLLIEAVLVQVGDQVRLVCDYAEGRDQLYSVKWYKDNMEFYRCRHTSQ